MRRRWLIAVAAGALGGAALAAPVAAHPLGNFSVNHHHTITLASDGVADRVVIDRAEIPTAQAADAIDADGDGTTSQSELDAHAATECEALAGQVRLTVDRSVIAFEVEASSFANVDGQAGLSTSRLECGLTAPADLDAARTVAIVDEYAGDRVGWHEMVAIGTDVHIVQSPVPERSTTDELRSYPVDPLASPLDVRSVTLDVRPGAVTSTAPSAGRDGTSDETGDRSESGALGGLAGHVNDRFDDLIGRRDLTLGVGLLAIALALVLGASHALLPGHGKTLMAAYIAGRQGTSRDAVVVGATVTATHTGGVLALGLALSLSTSLAGERVLGWLGLASGLTVAGLGLALLASNLRNRRAGVAGFVHGHHHGYHFHDHDHDHGHDHAHDHDHDHGHSHDHGNSHDHGGATVGLLERPQLDQAFGRRQFTGVELEPEHEPQQRHLSRRSLVAMGVAGGLVPSPSALVILLSAIALGRTWFGVLLVVGYGLGMAATLTAAGLVLVLVRDRFGARVRRSGDGVRRLASMWSRCVPYATAALVIVVGTGLALRSVSLI